VRVKLDVNKPLLGLVGLHREGQERMHFQVLYEKMPKFCALCGQMGHGELECGDGVHNVHKNQYGTWMLSPIEDWHPQTLGVRTRGLG
jgi:hypothetical protein